MLHQVKKSFGFTLIELLVVISIIALLLGILVPVLGVAKKNANILKEATSLRNIHTGLVTYGTSNKDWFPGLTRGGAYAGWNGAATPFIGKYYAAATNAASASVGFGSVANTTAYAQALMMDENISAPAQWISPGETSTTGNNIPVTHVTRAVHPATATRGTAAATTAATSLSTTGMVSVFNSSYAVLAYGTRTTVATAIPKGMVLKPEWKSNQNQRALVLASRLIGGTTTGFHSSSVTTSFNSVWTDSRSGIYKGSVVRGDSSTTTESFKHANPAEPFGTLKYGGISAAACSANNLSNVVGPFGYATVTTGATTENNIGVAVSPPGSFRRGQLASGLN